MDRADFIENLAEILPKQDVDDWIMLLRHSPEIYKMLLREFESDIIDMLRDHTRG